MTTTSIISQPSQAVIPFQPPLNSGTFVQREMDKIAKKALAHFMELALTNAQVLSCDVIPNRSVMATIGVMRRLGLRQDQRFGIAQRSLELNPWETAPCMREFRLSQDQGFALCKIFIKNCPSASLCYLQPFNLAPDRFFDVAVRFAMKNQFTACFGDLCGSLPLERRFIIAKLCAENYPEMTAGGIQRFDLTQGQRFEIAKICAKTEDIKNSLKYLGLTDQQEVIIKKLCAFPLDYTSVQKSIGSTPNQVMVYGFAHAKYGRVYEALKAPGSPFLKVFDYGFGNPEDPEYCVTLEGTAIEEFPAEPETSHFTGNEMSRECKAAVTNLVRLENREDLEDTFVLSSVAPVWEQPDWNGAWANRIQQKSLETHQQERRVKRYYWRDQLLTLAKRLGKN